MPTNSAIHSGSEVLAAIIICGLFGVIGQGIRAVLGLKKANLNGPQVGPQAQFSAAYFALSIMIGFIAGIVAGIITGLQNFINIDLNNMKLLLGIVASGYAGADFIESSLSLVLPNTNTSGANPQTAPPASPPAAVPAPAPNAALVSEVFAALPAPEVTADSLNTALGIVANSVNRATWVAPLIAAFDKFDMDTKKRVAVAMGQFLVEAGSAFQELIENLNYTHAERIAEVFPRSFPTVQSAEPYVGTPEALGNLVYANRLGNGDVKSGDGYLFRGRGLIQLTGRDEYSEFGATIGKSAEDAAAYCDTTEGAAMSGCWYLSSRGCLPLADQWQVDMVTKKVNGAAMLGKAQRLQYANDMLKRL
jgi:predicted chitinase